MKNRFRLFKALYYIVIASTRRVRGNLNLKRGLLRLTPRNDIFLSRDLVLILCLAFFILSLALISNAFAVPETVSVRVTDVTPSSFSVVWMTDVAANPSVEVYSDSSMKNQITGSVRITPMPGTSGEVADAARQRGIMKVQVSGLSQETRYFVRTVTADTQNPTTISYSPLLEVITPSKVMPYNYSEGLVKEFSNDLIPFPVYILPGNTETKPGMGGLVILEIPNSPYPITAFIGNGINAPEGVIDLNNLFGIDGLSLNTAGGEKTILKIYRGGPLSTLIHYRRLPQDSGLVYVSEPLKGFFADINLNRKVDEEDFIEFKKQYRTLPTYTNYNPDFDFVEDPEGKVDVREFSKFSREYGRTDVE